MSEKFQPIFNTPPIGLARKSKFYDEMNIPFTNDTFDTISLLEFALLVIAMVMAGMAVICEMDFTEGPLDYTILIEK